MMTAPQTTFVLKFPAMLLKEYEPTAPILVVEYEPVPAILVRDVPKMKCVVPACRTIAVTVATL